MPGFPRLLQSGGGVLPRAARRGGERRAATARAPPRRASASGPASGAPRRAAVLDGAYQGLRGEFDARYGGLGRAPKFPQPMAFDFLLRCWRRTGVADGARRWFAQTLDAHGPGRDVRPAGRRVPSLLGRRGLAGARTSRRCCTTRRSSRLLYLQAWQATGDPEYRRVDRGDPRLRPARDDPPGRRLLLDAGRGLGGRGGEVLPLGRAPRSRRSSTPRPPASRSGTGAWPPGRTSRGGASSTSPRAGRGGGRARARRPTRLSRFSAGRGPAVRSTARGG